MLNFTTNFVNDVYIASKHTYFIYDCRMTCVQDFIHHNLRSPPCFINYFEGRGMKMVTLFSQSPNENAIFGGMSPYSLPYHLSNLKDSYDRCRSQKNIPVIPHIEDRLNFPTAGVQLVSNIDGMSIYFTNIFGEIFCQDIILQPSQSEKPIEKMHHWVTEIDGKNDPGLNIVHQANASSAFNLNTDFNDIDLFDHYEKCNINEFLEDEDFDYTKWKSETFLEIWGDAEDEEMKSLLQLKPTLSKVEDWIESTKFEIKEDLDDAQKH
ncbi:hypothetical protein HHI36_004926 [Cryptolaemus montrouzieri]|uniref:Uncharacterized protein n=1 Tax=Cryptolaemus montrouzieri TaxID=559131 RepID=A0ABD2NSL7_9CUCU